MKDLYIIGAGGFGREILAMLLFSETIVQKKWNIIGFLDDTEDPLKGKACDAKVVGTIQDYFPKPNDALALCIADPASKEKIVSLLQPRGAVFETIVYPYAHLGTHCSIGEGAVIAGCFGMTVNCSIGRFATLQACTFGHDVHVGDFVTISSYVHIMGNASIGDRVFIGGNVAIAPHAVIEDDAYVGVGSVVVKKIARGEKVFGNPAREIGF